MREEFMKAAGAFRFQTRKNMIRFRLAKKSTQSARGRMQVKCITMSRETSFKAYSRIFFLRIWWKKKLRGN